MKKYGQCVFLVVMFLAFLGCDIGFSHPTNLPSTNNPPPAGSTIKTILWELGADGFYQFYTNDQQYFGYGITCLRNNNSNIFEIEIKKISGARNVYYGMIFGAVDGKNNYFVYITVDGSYLIGKCVNDNLFATEPDFTYSPKLRTGYNVSNTIRVTKSGSHFQVSFNGNFIDEFTDSSITGSGIGAIAVVGPSGQESFPNTPVEVKFRQTSQ
jgi:hypothetical protein